jgi:hypothetical protein
MGSERHNLRWGRMMILELNFDEEEDVHRCSSTGLFNEMHQVVHKELHVNLSQILDFYGEGDYMFVLNGGPIRGGTKVMV